MTLQTVIEQITVFTQQHQHWAIPIVFLLAFAESLAFLSLLAPATVILLALGGLIGQSGLAFWPIWSAAVVGAILGDWLSYYLGYHYQHQVANWWPFAKHPQWLVRGQTFFDKWGEAGVFLGRFFGPLRAVVPLVAGICAMPNRKFQAANIASALIWATGMLAPGAFGVPWLKQLFS